MYKIIVICVFCLLAMIFIDVFGIWFYVRTLIQQIHIRGRMRLLFFFVNGDGNTSIYPTLGLGRDDK